MISAERIEAGYPSSGLAVEGPSLATVERFRATGAEVFAEVGVYEGDTTLAVAEALAGRGEIHLFDFEDKVQAVVERLAAEGHRNVVAHPNSRKLLDSYNWSLMRLLREGSRPRFDYVFLDGAHTWATDALAFLLIDRLLRPGGHLEFDDYHWTIGRSPSMNPQAFPATDLMYTPEQISSPQVALVVDLLVRPDGRYEEVVENRLFRKRGAG